MPNKTSFGKYFDDQRDRIVKDMQNKNAQQNIEWMENYKKKKEIWSDERLDALHQVNMADAINKGIDAKEKIQEKRDDTYIDEDTQLFWWESIGT